MAGGLDKTCRVKSFPVDQFVYTWTGFRLYPQTTNRHEFIEELDSVDYSLETFGGSVVCI